MGFDKAKPPPTLKEEIVSLRRKRNVDPLSKSFIFGDEPRFVKMRHARIRDAEGEIKPLIRGLIDSLSEMDRAKLFLSPYDLGSLRNIDKQKLTLDAMASDVRATRAKAKNSEDTDNSNPTVDIKETRKHEFESITEQLRKLTGRRFSDYADKQTSLRVINLLSEVNRRVIDPNRPGGRSILSMLKINELDGSFEARTEFPTEAASGNILYAADLKSYLTLSGHRGFRKCDTFFNPLIDVVNQMYVHLEKLAQWKEEPEREEIRLAGILGYLKSLTLSTHQVQEEARLDLDLYFHICKWEFANFVYAISHVRPYAKPPTKIKPIFEAMHSVFAQIQSTHDSIEARVFNDLQIKTMLTKHEPELFELVELALSRELEKSRALDTRKYALNLMVLARIFGNIGITKGVEPKYSFLEIISALCTTAQELYSRTNYYPKVYGDGRQPGSILKAIVESPLERAIDQEEPPEAFSRILVDREAWIRRAICGQEQIAKQKEALRMLLLTKSLAAVLKPTLTEAEGSFRTLLAAIYKLRLTNLG